MPTEECLEECEILTSIYSEAEIKINHDEPRKGESLISMVLLPSTGDDESIRHVTVTLEFILPPKYPEVLPTITFRNPRGLSDVKLSELEETVINLSKELVGSSMMFQIRDIVQEFLTTNNHPASECPICLLSFTDFDIFFRTDCFHYYHSKCLGTYLQHVITTFDSIEQKLPNEKLVLSCPVCRMELDKETDVEKLLNAPPPSEETLESQENISLPEDWLRKREALTSLYLKQKQQGGIIDLTEKKLLVISDVVVPPIPDILAAGDSDAVGPIPIVNERTESIVTRRAEVQPERQHQSRENGIPAPGQNRAETQTQGNGNRGYRAHNRSHRGHYSGQQAQQHQRGENRSYHNRTTQSNHSTNTNSSTDSSHGRNARGLPSNNANPGPGGKEGSLTASSDSQKAPTHSQGRGHSHNHHRGKRPAK